MAQKPTIQKILASFLLLLLSISITPKSFFHDLIADHKDGSYCNHPIDTSSHLHQQGFNCHFDDLVVTVPFLLIGSENPLLLNLKYVDKTTSYSSSYTQYCFLQKVNRGPPVT
ncbi:MAG: hypothetical protein M3Y85_10270 [Bacteroidota bacterium]|nr:hypothetical protein [Bacteroidota bacterium]